MNEFQEALEGKISTETWDAEKLVKYHAFLKTAAKDEETKVAALREAKRVENERVEKAKKEASDLEEAARKAREGNPPAPAEDPKFKQFRDEQVEKARRKLYSEVKLTEEEKVTVEDKFKRLDTGKLDADFIYHDFVSAVAAANPTKYLELTKGQEEAERMAAEETARQAAGGHAPPSGEEKKKWSQEVLDLAKKAGITPEEASRQVSQGMSRTYA